ncbi:hypothetical protein Sste5346_002828 [Sporothrix stenoceras]|uniref:DRBM domain-containing protein n=1 Tax=Sporothrix stenoceras TaxID=5173 RepID=A0ABR3ZFK7_9PEZI
MSKEKQSQPQSLEFVSFDGLKAWVFDQEEYERRTGKPVPLTDEQRRAIAVLAPPPPPPPAVVTNWDDVDTISLLMRYLQARKSSKGEINYPEFLSEDVPGPAGTIHWRTRCRLSVEAYGHLFPPLNHPRPSDCIFTTKKASRQFAARCAIEWLVAQGRMSADGEYIEPLSKSPAKGIANATKKIVVASKPVVNKPVASAAVVGKPVVNNTVASIPVKQSLPRPLKQVPPQQQTVIQTAEASLVTESHDLITVGDSQYGGGSIEAVIRQQQEWQQLAEATPRVQSMASYAAGGGGNGGETNTGRSGQWNLVMAAADNGTNATNGRGNPPSVNERPSHFRSHGNDYEVSNIHMLDQLCRAMKLGSPTYELRPSRVGAEGIFDGRIVFSPPNAKGGGPGKVPNLPAGVGEVYDVFTKKAAREKIAQSVLQYFNQDMRGTA